ncbi:DUF397 domain-containing protein [Actinosynnema sp. NPDC047251]|uniref:DUF397 domain-containing protein n=1 Tax=Saccharothrix espanaensis (strain ATCC 51144 / DSM 44229 / JCM 9112 / NBRC 15066 / NRRL 15764) TaxID=1179773 RepID=K0K612_SACES|nr:DUF397 domain-containing protein [Saccharothrix espanaensis]CCH35705.1 hypothetical protein BN6_84910 [Saccharothrix espanaensis DSM 44229]
MPAPDFPTARWRKASYTEGNDNCVEVARVTGVVALRDSKNRTGPVLAFPAASFAGLLDGLKTGRV